MRAREEALRRAVAGKRDAEAARATLAALLRSELQLMSYWFGFGGWGVGFP